MTKAQEMLDLADRYEKHGVQSLVSREEIKTIIHGLRLAAQPQRPCDAREVVWLREVDAGTDNVCWVISNRVDLDAVPFFMGSAYAVSRPDREGGK